ncbi:MAG: hypothetical protein KDD53_09085, partial [Bdellovibrionales bacterium]|nr:hypothetical protein [Bdellovibrionales bacterium]
MGDGLDKVFLGIDQGSSSTKAVVLGLDGSVLFSERIAVSTNFLSDIEVEQNPIELFESVKGCIDNALAFCDRENLHVSSIGLACQRSGVLAFDRDSFDILHPLISWRDTRFSSQIESLERYAGQIYRQGGIPPHPGYAGAKIGYLQSRFGAPALISTLDAFLLFRLSGGSYLATEATHAARTLLFNLKALNWDSDLCRIFNVDRSRLLKIDDSISNRFSYRGIPVTAMLGDQQAALLGFGAPRRALLNLGTLSSLIVSSGESVFEAAFSPRSVLYSQISDGARLAEYQVEASVPSDPMIQMLINRGYAKSREEVQETSDSTELTINDPVLFFKPSDWQGGALAAIDSDSRDLLKPEKIVTALVENLGFVLSAFIDLFVEKNLIDPKTEIVVSGGMSRLSRITNSIMGASNSLLTKADLEDSTAYGAALMGALGVGVKLPSKLNGSSVPHVSSQRNSVTKERYIRWLKLRTMAFENQLPES